MNALMRAKREYLRHANKKYGHQLTEIPREEWPVSFLAMKQQPFSVLRSRDYLAQLFRDGGTIRITVARAAINDDGDWLEGISWDELQRVKNECGYEDAWMVELFPPEREVVNVANMRHLWLLPEPPECGWKSLRTSAQYAAVADARSGTSGSPNKTQVGEE